MAAFLPTHVEQLKRKLNYFSLHILHDIFMVSNLWSFFMMVNRWILFIYTASLSPLIAFYLYLLHGSSQNALFTHFPHSINVFCVSCCLHSEAPWFPFPAPDLLDSDQRLEDCLLSWLERPAGESKLPGHWIQRVRCLKLLILIEANTAVWGGQCFQRKFKFE